jgi:uncharacterized membrane protein YidH (DUF202 family)
MLKRNGQSRVSATTEPPVTANSVVDVEAGRDSPPNVCLQPALEHWGDHAYAEHNALSERGRAERETSDAGAVALSNCTRGSRQSAGATDAPAACAGTASTHETSCALSNADRPEGQRTDKQTSHTMRVQTSASWTHAVDENPQRSKDSCERQQPASDGRKASPRNSGPALGSTSPQTDHSKPGGTGAAQTPAPNQNPLDSFRWQQLLQYHASRNVGSRARDLLALERTFLSMIRTSLSSVALGVAIAKLIGTRLADATGTVFISLGLLTLIIGLWRYYTQILAIERGQFAADTVFPWIVVVLLLTSGVVSLVLIFK